MLMSPPHPRASCLITAAALAIAALLIALGALLPPIKLAERLAARAYSPLNAAAPALAFDNALRLSLPPPATTSDFALRIARWTPGQADTPAWLAAALSRPPAAAAQVGAVYQLDSRGEPPARLQIELQPPSAADAAALMLYGWDGAAWRYLPTRHQEGLLSATADFMPLALASFESQPTAGELLITQNVADDLDPDFAALATILSPAGLRPLPSGALVGSLAPGGDVDSSYLYMPVLRNFSDARAIDRGTVAALLNNPSLRAAHITHIVDLARFNRFAGVFIDYRGLTAAERADFSRFINQLGAALAADGLRLGVVLPTAFSQAEGWAAAGYDWRAIGAAADFVQLRPVYDPRHFTAAGDGSVSGLLRHARYLIESHKILLGISLQSVREVAGRYRPLTWHESFAALGDVKLTAEERSATGTIQPGALISAALTGYPARLDFDDSAGSAYIEYLAESGDIIARIWLSDASTLQARLRAAAGQAFAGFAFDDLLAASQRGALLPLIQNLAAGQPAAASASAYAARWTIDSADGPLQAINSDINAGLQLTLIAPDGNYAVNWSLVSADGAGSARAGAALPLFRPTATPTPTPTPTPLPTPTPRPVAVAAAPVSSGGGGPPAPGSITIEIGGHVHNPTSGSTVGAMRAAGMQWMKVQARYSRHNPPNLSELIGAAHNNGFKILIGALGDPAEMGREGQAYIDAFTDWLAQVANHGADAIEVWNEPNLDREWPRGQISGAAYAGMLASAYQKIKQANRGVMVISAAPAPTGVDLPDRVMPDNRWLREMVAAGGLEHLDCVGAHYNEGIVPPDQTTGDPRGDNYYTRYFYGMLNGYISITRRPICFTELGYLTADGLPSLPSYFSWAKEVTLQQQAAWLAQAAALASRSGQVRLFIVWNVDFTHYGSDPQAGYAIIRPDGSCPACVALAAAR